MNGLKKRMLGMGLAAALALSCGLARAQQAGAAAAAAAANGAASIVSNEQADQMRNAERQAEDLQRREQGARKARAATANMPAPRTTTAPAKNAGEGPWQFGKVTAVHNGKPEADKDGAARATDVLRRARGGDAAQLQANAETLMQDAGYLLWHETKATTNAAARTVDVEVDFGHIATLTVVPVKDIDAKPVEQTEWRWFGDGQIRNRYMRGIAENKIFNYNTLYERFYQLNAQPDLRGALHLRPVFEKDKKGEETEKVASPELRQLALRLEVEELEKPLGYTMPLHFVLGVDNNGTDASDNWMGRATVQYLNLWKRDGVLTLNVQKSLSDFDALVGLAASYYQPHYILDHEASFTLYGGWTDVDSQDVVEDIDIKGNGSFFGLQESVDMLRSDRHQLKLAVGAVWRNVEDHMVVRGEKLEGNEVTVMPLTLALMYSNRKEDLLAGMNFLTLEFLTQFGDFLGTADAKEMRDQRLAAKDDYQVLHIQAARLQMTPQWLADAIPWNWLKKSMLFVKANGQVASGALIPAEQFGLGGDGSVRGYSSREYLGDHGWSGTVEWRSPVVAFPWKSTRLQGVVFVDAGGVKIEDPLPGEKARTPLAGAGAGVRLAMTDYFQVKFDVAQPLVETDASDSLCFHLNAQVQF